MQGGSNQEQYKPTARPLLKKLNCIILVHIGRYFYICLEFPVYIFVR